MYEWWYSSDFEPGWYSCFDWTRFLVLNIELRLDLGYRLLRFASRTNLESVPRFAENLVQTCPKVNGPVIRCTLWDKFWDIAWNLDWICKNIWNRDHNVHHSNMDVTWLPDTKTTVFRCLEFGWLLESGDPNNELIWYSGHRCQMVWFFKVIWIWNSQLFAYRTNGFHLVFLCTGLLFEWSV